MKPEKKSHYTLDMENLAIPEIQTGKVKHEEEATEEPEEMEVVFDNLAIPEIRLPKE